MLVDHLYEAGVAVAISAQVGVRASARLAPSSRACAAQCDVDGLFADVPTVTGFDEGHDASSTFGGSLSRRPGGNEAATGSRAEAQDNYDELVRATGAQLCAGRRARD